MTLADPTPRILLLAIHMSDATDIYTISRSSDGAWSVSDQRERTEAVNSPLPGGSFVIEAKNGRRCKAERNALMTALSPNPTEAVKGRYLWVSAGARGVKCVVDITGDRIGRADWPSKAGKVQQVCVIEKNGELG